MAKAGGCMFRIGYFFYTRTRVGYYYHQRDIAKAKEKLKDCGGHHSNLTPFDYGDLQIVPIPMLLDNYAYLVTDRRTNTSVVIDPGHAEPVQVYLSGRNIMPDAVLVTHKHWDHSGGNKEMRQHYPNIRVYGSGSDHVHDITHPLQAGETLEFGGLKFNTMITPGHTTGHMVYILDGSPYGVGDSIFSGDLLFLAGCGRMFEGTAETMLHSLDQIYSLPNDTLIWPGHEYARENLEFSCHLEPENQTAKEKLKWVKSQREKRFCTCPSIVQEEKQYNPFLRTREESMPRVLGIVKDGIFATADDATRARMLCEIRERKDQLNYKL
ncbi:probable hydrolase PNKD [Littorina saxatilis]|uniref:Metallo-beta-lactamase domain-containing protein n=1 Tax=Littorina saxatilis TaxID=31220 RepID=A0AAN9BUH7_9CAEN